MRLTQFLAVSFFCIVSASGQSPNWQLVWSDEFTGAAGTLPDPKKWTYDLGAGGWGNQELETYTSSADNASLDGNGNLVIHALKSDTGRFTSARLKTQGLFTITYGRIEARIKIPFGQGIWPAFWMLGQDISKAGWPASGEIDIMENIGKEPTKIHGSLHGPGYSGGNDLTGTYTLPSGNLSDDFHTYAIEWKPGSIEFFVDSTSYEKQTSSSVPKGAQWIFNKPFFLLLNVAVGGSWPGYPDATTQFPQAMTVDYVRVYRSATEPVITPGGLAAASDFMPKLAPGALASVFGSGFSSQTSDSLFDSGQNSFVKSVNGTAVTVDGTPAPLTFVSPDQINFQIPWRTQLTNPVNVQVTRDGIASNPEPVSLSATAPSVFMANGAAIVTCPDGRPAPGSVCTLWGNGFGQISPAQTDGAPASALGPSPAAAACSLIIAKVPAQVLYCGAAPGLIIDQLNFVFPQVATAGDPLAASLSVGGNASSVSIPTQP